MSLVINAPGKYIQFPGAAAELGRYAAVFGKKAAVLSTASNWRRIGDKVSQSLAEWGCEAVFAPFTGETTNASIEALKDFYSEHGCDMIIGAGGGKSIDTARAAADIVMSPLIVLPTVASNDSPCSALAVIHNSSGAVIELRTTKRSPDVVLVDTEIILRAPEKLFVAGMGDALATWFEARACMRSGAGTIAGGKPSVTALALAELCNRILVEHGYKALCALREGRITEDLELVVHACIYLSGLGFESGGVAGAHAINDGFSAQPEAQGIYHGDLVAFGTLSMLMLENAPDREIEEVAAFMKSVGLPMTFAQLGITPTDSLLYRAAKEANEHSVMSNMPFKVTDDMTVDAMRRADALGSVR